MRLETYAWPLFAALFLFHLSTAVPSSSLGPLREHPRRTNAVDLLQRRKFVYKATSTGAIALYTWNTLLPLSTASPALLELYTTLFNNASGPWRTLPRFSWFTAECRNIYIDFSASDAATVPWSFVAEFAAHMIRATEKGFTGEFRGEYRHFDTGTVISVGLRVVMVAAAA